MKKALLISTFLISSLASAHNSLEHKVVENKSPKSFGYEYEFSSGINKNHLFELYINDNCLKECKIINSFIENKYLSKVKNINIIKFQHTMLNNKFWSAPYSSVYQFDRYKE